MEDPTSYSPADILSVNLVLTKSFFQAAFRTGAMSQEFMDVVFDLATDGIKCLDQTKFGGALRLLEQTRAEIQLFAPEPPGKSG